MADKLTLRASDEIEALLWQSNPLYRKQWNDVKNRVSNLEKELEEWKNLTKKAYYIIKAQQIDLNDLRQDIEWIESNYVEVEDYREIL